MLRRNKQDIEPPLPLNTLLIFYKSIQNRFLNKNSDSIDPRH